MNAFLVVLFPIVLMIFAVGMSGLENRLKAQTSTVTEDEVEEFLDQARPEEVNTFIREGWTRALARFRLRRRPRGRRHGGPDDRRRPDAGGSPDRRRSR